jgi:hypothetical protein
MNPPAALRPQIFAALVVSWFVVPSAVLAQAWVPPAGEAAVSIDYQSFNSPGHLNRLGQPIGGGTQSHTVLVEIEYGITNKIAVTGALPYITAKYTGVGPACPLCVTSPFEFDLSHLDDGAYHGTFQDFRFGLRYNAVQKGLLLTPFLGGVLPSHHYENTGEAAVGRRFPEGQLGINAGRDFGSLVPRAYAQARYSYTFVPRDESVPLNRSNAIVEIGYSITSALAARGVATWQRTHGGLAGFPEFGKSENLLVNHDRLLRDNNWRGGAGVSYALTDSLDLSATVITVISGTNTHRGTGITVEMAWRFSRNLMLASVGGGMPKTRATRRAPGGRSFL